MKNLLAALILLLGLTGAASAQSNVTSSTTAQIPIAGTVAASTRIITALPGRRIYVTALLLVPVPTSVVTLTYGTGTNCGTGTTSLTGALTFSAGQTLNYGDGSNVLFIIPTGNDLCITIATAVAPGALAYAQF